MNFYWTATRALRSAKLRSRSFQNIALVLASCIFSLGGGCQNASLQPTFSQSDFEWIQEGITEASDFYKQMPTPLFIIPREDGSLTLFFYEACQEWPIEVIEEHIATDPFATGSFVVCDRNTVQAKVTVDPTARVISWAYVGPEGYRAGKLDEFLGFTTEVEE